MAKLVQMQTTAANPEHVLEAGKVYNLHDSLAAEYVRAGAAVYVDKEQLPPKTKILRKTKPDPNDPHGGKPAPTIVPKKDEDDGDVEEIVGEGDDEPTQPTRRGPKVPKPAKPGETATGTTPDPQAKPK